MDRADPVNELHQSVRETPLLNDTLYHLSCAHTSVDTLLCQAPGGLRQGYVNVRLIVRAVGVNTPATAAKATCVACGARESELRSGSPVASVAGWTTLT